MKSLLRGADINSVAIVARVTVTDDGLVGDTEWLVSPIFWDFIVETRVLKSWMTRTPSQTYIRLAYKSWQSGLPFHTTNVSYVGDIYESHVKKLEALKSWEVNPLAHVTSDKRKTGTFRLVPG